MRAIDSFRVVRILQGNRLHYAWVAMADAVGDEGSIHLVSGRGQQLGEVSPSKQRHRVAPVTACLLAERHHDGAPCGTRLISRSRI